MKTFTHLLRAALALLISVLLLSGCGGGGGNHAPRGKGGLAVRIVWPSLGRVIPANSASVRLVVKRGNDVVATHDFDRDEAVNSGSSSVTEDNIGGLDPGDYSVEATAYAEDDPTDASVPLARGTTTGLNIVANQSTQFSVTMNTELVRFKVTERDNLEAFVPSTFYLDAAGASVGANGSGRIIPRFKTGVGAATVELTPLANDGQSLLLLPTTPANAGDALIKVTADGGLQAAYVSSGGSAYQSSISYSGTIQPAGSISVEYRDFQSGAIVPLKTFTTPVQFNAPSSDTTVTFDGLPTQFSADTFKIVATLKEADETLPDNTISPGASYSSSPVDGQPKRLAFSGVTDRGRAFTITASLQIATFGGGFVEIAKTTASSPSLPLPLVTFATADYYPITLVAPGSTFPATGVPRDGALYGTDARPFALSARINNAGPVVQLLPNPFELTRTSGSGASVESGYQIRVASNDSATDVTATFTALLEITATGTGTTDINVGGNFSVKVNKNTDPIVNAVVTFSGLPTKFNGDSFQIVATLKEANLNSPGNPPSQGATYESAPVNGQPTQVAFSGVANRGRAFTLAASLQIATQGGGFVEIAKFSGRDVTASFASNPVNIAAAFQAGDYYSMTLGTPPSSFPAGGVDRNGFVYGPPDHPYWLNVRINGGSAKAISPAVFNLSLESTTPNTATGATVNASNSNITVPSNSSSVAVTSTFRVRFARPPTGTPQDLGTFTVLVKKNTGVIDVEVK